MGLSLILTSVRCSMRIESSMIISTSSSPSADKCKRSTIYTSFEYKLLKSLHCNIFLCIVFCNFRVETQSFLTLFVIYLVQRHGVEDRLDEAAVVGDDGDPTL